MPNEQFFSYNMALTSYIQCDHNKVHFVQDQHIYLDFYSEQQSTGSYRHVIPLGHIILISRKPDFRSYSLILCATTTNFIVFVLT